MDSKKQVSHLVMSSSIRDSRETIVQTPRRVLRACSRALSPAVPTLPAVVTNKPNSPGWSKAIQNIRASSSPLTSLRRSTRSPSVTPKTPKVGLSPIPGPSCALPSQVIPDLEPFRCSSLEYEDEGSGLEGSTEDYMGSLPPSQPKPPLITHIQENLEFTSGTIQDAWTEGVTGPCLVILDLTRRWYFESQPPSPTGEEPGARFGRETLIVLKDIICSLDYLVMENNKRAADLYSTNTNIFEIGNTFVELAKMFSEGGEVHEALRELRRQQMESEDRILDSFHASEGKFTDLKDTVSLLIQRVNNLDQKVTTLSNHNVGNPTQASPSPAPAVVKPPPPSSLTHAQISRELFSSLEILKKRTTGLKKQLQILSSSPPDKLIQTLQAQQFSIEKVQSDLNVVSPESWFQEDNWRGFELLNLDVSHQGFHIQSGTNTGSTENKGKSKEATRPSGQAQQPAQTPVTSAAAPAPVPQPRQPIKNDAQRWVLYLGGIPVVDEDSRLSPQEIWQRINRLDKSKFPFSLVNSYWSKSGHTIILAFDKNDDPDNILIHTNAILRELTHGKPIDKMQLCRDGQMGKVFLNNVPCRNPSDMDQAISEGELQLEIAKNPLLNCLQFINKPCWATKDLDDKEKNIRKATVFFSFEDPKGGYSSDILTHAIYLFGKRVFVSEVAERINIVQCNRCWKFGKIHSNCQITCMACNSADHSFPDHFKSCKQCVLDNQVDPSSCPHITCANCQGPHFADSASCRFCHKFISFKRSQRAGMRNQPARY